MSNFKEDAPTWQSSVPLPRKTMTHLPPRKKSPYNLKSQEIPYLLPQNITAIDRNGTLELEWSPITSNVGEVSYMMNVKTGETLEDLFGNFVQMRQSLGFLMPNPTEGFPLQSNAFPMPEITRLGKSLCHSLLLTSLSFTVPPPSKQVNYRRLQRTIFPSNFSG